MKVNRMEIFELLSPLLSGLLRKFCLNNGNGLLRQRKDSLIMS